MATSKLQRYVSQQLSIHFGGYTIRENHRPEWLNSGDGGNLELDFFIEELSVAIEVQGRQHYEYVEFFHQDHNGFKKRLKYDRIKRDICSYRGIKFFEIAGFSDVQESLENIYSIKNHQYHSGEELRQQSPIYYYDSYIRGVNEELDKLVDIIINRRKITSIRKGMMRRKEYNDLAMFDIRTFGGPVDIKRYKAVTAILERKAESILSNSKIEPKELKSKKVNFTSLHDYIELRVRTLDSELASKIYRLEHEIRRAKRITLTVERHRVKKEIEKLNNFCERNFGCKYEDGASKEVGKLRRSIGENRRKLESLVSQI